MHPSSLALLAVLVASSSSAFAVSMFNAGMPAKAKAENFAHASAKAEHDQRWHATVHGQPSFADLSDWAPSRGLDVAAEHAAPQAQTQAQDHAPPLAIPEPSTWALMFAGLAAVGFLTRRRR